MSDVLKLMSAENQDPAFKQKLKRSLGKVSSLLFRKRALANFKNPASDEKLLDRLILSYFRHRSTSENRADFLERMHSAFWKGDGGAAFATNCDHRFNDLFLDKQLPDFNRLKKLLSVQPSINRVVEVGTSSGLFMEYLLENLEHINSAVGIDINETQIRKNQFLNKLSNVEYVAADARDWINRNRSGDTVYVSNGGVLEYFTRSSLDQLLQKIGESGRSFFYASEPIAVDHSSEQLESIPFGEELSFSHNYRDAFESNGFKVEYQRSTEYVAACGTHFKMLATIASNVE